MENLLQVNIFIDSNYQKSFLEKSKILLKQKAAKFDKSKRIKFAQSFCYALVKEYWDLTTDRKNCKWPVISHPSEQFALDKQSSLLAFEIGAILANLENSESGDFIGTLYATLLPDEVRSEFGIYYTPPLLVERLLNIISEAGFDWTSGKILDPACGGAAFLAPIAEKIVNEFNRKGITDSDIIFRHIAKNLRGIEIDHFAGWISAVLLETILLDLCVKTKKRLPNLITIANSLEIDKTKIGGFDLVVGNPPYAKVTLSDELRLKFSKSLYGHANLYGVFTDIATKILNKDGLIAYVTPTSFLGGQYFKALRKLLSDVAPPITLDFINQRSGIFDNVLQETALVLYKSKSDTVKKTTVNSISITEKNKKIHVEEVGKFSLPEEAEDPWLFPRSVLQREVLGSAIKMNYRLKDYGFIVNTGQLVWNRHKEQLKENKTKNSFPIIWAESILANGIFKFKHTRKNHCPFIELNDAQDFLITKSPGILVQRTTAKEQSRRVLAAILPKSFLDTHKNGVVIENHINIIKLTSKSIISLKTLLALLNSDAIDQIFRCISGSVAVSAYELNAIPLPNPEDIVKLETLVKKNEPSLVNTYITKIYGQR